MAIDPKTGLPIPDGFAGSKRERLANQYDYGTKTNEVADFAGSRKEREANKAKYDAKFGYPEGSPQNPRTAPKIKVPNMRNQQAGALTPTPMEQPRNYFANLKAEEEKRTGTLSATAGKETVTLGSSPTSATTPSSPTGTPYSVGGKPTAYTGGVTAEGAPNPYTGGVETASPAGTLYGVNQGIYSPENKQKAWQAAGGTGTYEPNAFYRDETTGEMKMKPGYVTATPTWAAPAVPGAPTPTTPSVPGAPAVTGAPAVPGAPTAPGVPTAPTWITGIPQVDTELAKLKEQKQKSIDDSYKAYELAKGSLEQNKAYYTNFDDVNARFTNVINDVKNAMQAKGETFLTDDEYQKIADKYGIGLSEVKNPISVFNALNLSDKGKQELGVAKYEQGIADFKTAYERRKADIATNLSNVEKSMNAQIDDAATTINRNIDAMTAQGAWSGAQRSSGYSQGLENVRSDGQKVIQRMNDQLAQTQTQSHLELSRLGEDFDKQLSRSKADLDQQLQTLKFNNGLMLSEATAKYGTGSKELSNALDAIREEFGAKSLDVFNKYLASVKSTNDLTTQKIEQIAKIDELTTKLSDKRFNEYTANNGLLLANASLTDIHKELVNGTITPKRYEDLRNVMQNSVVNTLGKFGTVSEHDLNSISHMLDTGSTPAQIVAQMRALPQYQKKVVDKVIDLGTKKRVQYADGSFEDIAETKSPIAVGSGSEIFDSNTGTYVPRPTAPTTAGTVGGTTGTTLSGTELMRALASGNYGGKKFFGVYASGDPTGANRANEYANISTTGIANDLAKFPDTKITEKMITDSATKFGIDPVMLATILKLDSSYGTKGKGARNNNPGNVGQTDTLDAQGITVAGYPTLEAGVDAVSQNLKKRLDALVSANPSIAKTETAAFDPAKSSLYEKYLSDKATLPTGMKFGTAQADRFISEAAAYKATKSEVSGLSPAAQRAYASKQVSGSSTEQTEVLNELQRAGVLDKGEGNDAYYRASNTDRSEFPSFLSARDSFNKIESILRKHGYPNDSGDWKEMIGGYDAAQQRLKSKTGLYDKDFNADFDALDALLNKELSQYMKDISGATVADAEVLRLMKQVPNVDMSESQFKEAIDNYGNSFSKATSAFLNRYGFSDMDSANRVILGNTAPTTGTAPATGTAPDLAERIRNRLNSK